MASSRFGYPAIGFCKKMTHTQVKRKFVSVQVASSYLKISRNLITFKASYYKWVIK